MWQLWAHSKGFLELKQTSKHDFQINNTKSVGELKERMDSVDICITNKKCQVKEIAQRTEQKYRNGRTFGYV